MVGVLNPESQRQLLENSNLNDDSALLNVTKRFLSKVTQAVPVEIAMAETAEDAMFATVTYLVADKNLGHDFGMSPTFALQLLDMVQEHQEEISAVLRSGQWQRKGLNFLQAPKSCEQSYKLNLMDFRPQCAGKSYGQSLV